MKIAKIFIQQLSLTSILFSLLTPSASAKPIRVGDEIKFCRDRSFTRAHAKFSFASGNVAKVVNTRIDEENNTDLLVRFKNLETGNLAELWLSAGFGRMKPLSEACPITSSVPGNGSSPGVVSPSNPEPNDPLIQSPAPSVGEGSPGYDPSRSAYNPDGTLNPGQVQRNETLYGVPYDPNNLQEQMIYCTLHSCE